MFYPSLLKPTSFKNEIKKYRKKTTKSDLVDERNEMFCKGNVENFDSLLPLFFSSFKKSTISFLSLPLALPLSQIIC